MGEAAGKAAGICAGINMIGLRAGGALRYDGLQYEANRFCEKDGFKWRN
jgi:hypothetical protein